MTKELAGVGIGLRPRFVDRDDLLRTSRRIDFLEVVPENWLLRGGRRQMQLQECLRRWPTVPHGVSLNIGGIGVHNVNFTIAVVDARSGAVLVGPEEIDAAMPAMTGAEMIKARVRGESQKSQIEAHVAATIAGWLGTGKDQRDSFVRAGI